MSKIAFIASPDRKYNIERALSLVKSEVIAGLRNSKSVVIKPSCPLEDFQLSSTNAEALRAVFEFIMPYVKNQVILAEGTESGNTLTAFKNYGYFDLQEQFDFAVVDLNTDTFETITLSDKKNKEIEVRLAKTLLQADYLISVSPPRTDNGFIFAGAISSVSIGGLTKPAGGLGAKLGASFNRSKNSKALIRQDATAINENIANIYSKVPLKLSVLDGYESMEGGGPSEGEMVAAQYGLVSSDPLAAEWLACSLMKIRIEDVGYLSLLGAGDLNNHFIIGDNWQEHVLDYKMPANFEIIRKWQ